MRPVTLDGDVAVIGALDRDETTDGVRLRRLPAWTKPQLFDPTLDLLACMPAGVRLGLRTDTTALELDVKLTVLQLGEDADVVPAALDLVVDGEVVDTQRTTEGTRIVVDRQTGAIDIRSGEPTTIRFDGIAGRDVEVWLPHNAAFAVGEMRIDDGAAAEPLPATGRRWAHHGSSISHCMEATQPTGTWPAVAARLAGVDLVNLAFAGQCQLDQHVARTMRDLDVDALSLKVGINVVNGDTMRERTFVPALHGFLDTVREGHPATPFALVSPIVCPPAESKPGPTLMTADGKAYVIDRPIELATGALTLERIRELLTMVVAARRDPNLHLLDGLQLFGPADVEDLPDLLHPNPAGYQRMGERFVDMAFAPGRPLA
jgi:hypothetical protein